MTVPTQNYISDSPADPVTPTAVIYARYSSHAQRDVSIEQQLKACRIFAERHGIEIVGTYEDRAISGTSDRRPGFQKMIRDAERADWSYVIVYTLDRFARDRYDSAVYKRQLKNCGVKVLSAMENISDDPTGVLMESLLEGLAEYYSKELSRKILRGMEDNASKCMVNGALPLGYTRGADGRYAIVENEAEIVQEIYRRVRDGEPLQQIIHDLNARCIKTKTGKEWNSSSFNRLLNNERYTGLYTYRDIRIPGGIPQIVPQELFDAVQHIMSTKKNPRTPGPKRRRREAGTYLLTGKLFCGHCKSPMIGRSGTAKSGNLHFYYSCREHIQSHTCSKKNVRRDLIEHAICSALKNTMLTDEGIRALADAAIAYQNKFTNNNEIDALRDQLAQISTSIRNIMSAIEAGIFTATTQSRLRELEEEQVKVSRQLSVALEDAEAQLTREDIIAALSTFQNGNVDDKAYQESLIDTFLVAAYLYDNEIKIVFNLGGKHQETKIPFDIDDIPLSDDIRICTSKVHQKKNRPKGRFFFWSVGNRTHLNATVRGTVAADGFIFYRLKPLLFFHLREEAEHRNHRCKYAVQNYRQNM